MPFLPKALVQELGAPTAVRLLFEVILAHLFYRAWRRARVSDSS